MKTTDDSIDLLGAPPLTHPALVAGARIAGTAWRTTSSGLAMVKSMSAPVGQRLKAPLVGPRRFESAREYRTWKKVRSARPPAVMPLQWPLGVWLLIGVGAMLWAGSLLK